MVTKWIEDCRNWDKICQGGNAQLQPKHRYFGCCPQSHLPFRSIFPGFFYSPPPTSRRLNRTLSTSDQCLAWKNRWHREVQALADCSQQPSFLDVDISVGGRAGGTSNDQLATLPSGKVAEHIQRLVQIGQLKRILRQQHRVR